MLWLSELARILTVWSSRWVPSSYTIACLLTMVAYLMGIFVAGKGPMQCLEYWGSGIWTLLVFAMQMSLIVVTGYVVAVSPVIEKLLTHLANLPKTPRAAVVGMALVSMTLGWVHWGLGLVTSAVFVRFLVRKHPRVDFRLLVAVAYLGMGCTWHAGPSGSAPLLIATPNHFMAADMGVIPMSETIFTSFNLGLVAFSVILLALLAWLLYPRHEDLAYHLSEEAYARVLNSEEVEGREEKKARLGGQARTFAAIVDSRYGINFVVGGAGLLWLGSKLWFGNAALSIDMLNFLFLFLGIFLHPSPLSFVRAGEQGVRFVHGIILQFPLYAGIFGIIKGSGLSEIIGNWFVAAATNHTLPLVVYWYSGIMNYFVPSGGSKWAVEAPYLVFAAKQLQVPIQSVVLAYAWGDMTSNLLQPFWCIPLLSAAKLEFREIVGYEIIVFLVHSLVISLAMLFI